MAQVNIHAAEHGVDGAGPWLVCDSHGHFHVVILAADSGEIEYTFDQGDDAEWFAASGCLVVVAISRILRIAVGNG